MTAHVAAAAVGGAATGAVAGVLGWIVLRHASFDTRLGMLAVLIGTGLLVDLAGRTPGPRRQVDESWLDRYRGGVYGFGFGVQLGAGIVTLVTASAFYLVPAAALASASAGAGAAIGAVAGLLRGMTLLAAWRVRDPQRLVAFHARMRAWRSPARAGSLVAQGALAAVALGALVA